MINAPSGRTPEKAPRWDLTGTEGCGGGIRFSWCSSMVSGYVGIYRRKKYVDGRPRGPRNRGARLPPGCALHPRGAHVAPPTYFFLLYIPTYPQTNRSIHENTFQPPQAFVLMRSHLWAFPTLYWRGIRSWRASTPTLPASPVMCE